MKGDAGWLGSILEHITLIEMYVAGMTFDDFVRDFKTQDAVAKRLEAIGEDSTNLSAQAKRATARIPWGDIVGMRNRLVHAYHLVDLKVVWNTRLPIFRG